MIKIKNNSYVIQDAQWAATVRLIEKQKPVKIKLKLKNKEKFSFPFSFKHHELWCIIGGVEAAKSDTNENNRGISKSRDYLVIYDYLGTIHFWQLILHNMR